MAEASMQKILKRQLQRKSLGMQRCNDLHHACAFSRGLAYANEEIEIEARAATFSFVLRFSIFIPSFM